MRWCAGYFPLQPSACVVWATMDVLLCTASIWHMCTMSLDRYCTLRYPISYGRSRTRTSVGLKIAFVWVVSTAVCAALAVAGFVDYSNVYVDGQCVPAVKDFVLYGSILAFYVPLVIMIVTYVLTVQILAENRRAMASIARHTAVGADKATDNGDCVTRRNCRWDGPVASAVESALCRTDGPLTGRYRRKSTASYRSTAEWKPGQTTKPLASRRKGVDDRSNILSSVTLRCHSDRNLTERDPMSLLDGDPSTPCQLSVNYDHTLSQPSTANLSCLSTATPQSNTSDEPDLQLDVPQDNVPQLCWEALSSPAAQSSPCGCSERQWRLYACRQCFRFPLQSERLGVLASCGLGFKETMSSNSPVLCIVENVCDSRRRLSDGVLLDCGQILARNQRRNNTACRGSTWSLLHRRRQRASTAELYNQTADPQRTPRSAVARPRNSAFMTDTSICCPDRLLDCSRWNRSLPPKVSDEQSVLQLTACGVGMDIFCTQRQRWRPKPERRECEHNAVESSTFNKCTTTDGDRLTVGSSSTRTSYRDVDRTHCGEMSWTGAGQATVGKVPGDRTTAVRWSAGPQRRAATDTSMSLNSTSQSDAAGNFQMSTFQRSCNSVSTAASVDISTSASTTKRQHTIASKERRASKVLGIIFGVFLVLWTPFFVVNILSVVCDSCLEALGSAGMSSIVWLGYASSLANPIVYTMFSTSFRTVFCRILTCRVCRGRRAAQSGVSYPLSRQATLGDAKASGRQAGQRAPEMAGLISR